jgi:hypothetical protein
MNPTLELIATLAASLFCGASIYINLVEHPARVSYGTRLAVTEFAPSYKRATVMQVLLAVAALISSLATWIMHSGTPWLIGGITIVLVIPFTAIFLLPINNILLSNSLNKDSDYARSLLDRCGKLHAVKRLKSYFSSSDLPAIQITVPGSASYNWYKKS